MPARRGSSFPSLKDNLMTDPKTHSTVETPSSPVQETSGPQVDTKLLEILVCPLTKARLQYDANTQELISPQAGLAYPIRDGIPIMLPDEARSIVR
jgi:uncharacterized protein